MQPSPIRDTNWSSLIAFRRSPLSCVMATASPALSNTSADTTSNTASILLRTSAALTSPNASSVAMSLVPGVRIRHAKVAVQKAQNPCHIHVLKGNSSFPDKTTSSTSSFNFQHSNETSSSGNAHRVTSLRQLSNNFAQFNNLQTPARAKKPLTRKEASQINEWRFSKLKEYKDRNMEIENESFDRYLKNISLLEDVFALNSNLEGENETVVSKLKIIRSENLRDRMRFIVNNGLKNLETETQETNTTTGPKKARYSGLVELNKKLTNARTAEDLKSCRLLKSQLLDRPEDAEPDQKSLKWFTTVTIHQEALGHIDDRFNGLKEIQQL
ncbi:unnamed protein product [Lactuca virosa]|uniref:Uncharacterized protein n=1 Tax=Lactuca virosa TaxID=75947 RepID=A0AAU9PT16_9ASTR|nr:unnamed protein product [Lactuca virosa]